MPSDRSKNLLGMTYPVNIGGREVSLAWTQEVARRFKFRLGTIGGHPTQKEMRSPATAEVAITKILWALLPSADVAAYPTPEDLYCALTDEAWPQINVAITGIYSEMGPSKEKKSTLTNSPSPESSSG